MSSCCWYSKQVWPIGATQSEITVKFRFRQARSQAAKGARLGGKSGPIWQHRAAKCHALSVTVTQFEPFSRHMPFLTHIFPNSTLDILYDTAAKTRTAPPPTIRIGGLDTHVKILLILKYSLYEIL